MLAVEKDLPRKIKSGLDSRAKHKKRSLSKKEIDDYVDKKIQAAIKDLKSGTTSEVKGAIDIVFRALCDYQEKNRAHPKWAFLPTRLYEALEDQIGGSETWRKTRADGEGVKIGGVEVFWSPHLRDIKMGR